MMCAILSRLKVSGIAVSVDRADILLSVWVSTFFPKLPIVSKCQLMLTKMKIFYCHL